MFSTKLITNKQILFTYLLRNCETQNSIIFELFKCMYLFIILTYSMYECMLSFHFSFSFTVWNITAQKTSGPIKVQKKKKLLV